MKRQFIIVLLSLIVPPSMLFAGTFYNPKPKNLMEKGREAAENLNGSFVIFYQMLQNIEGKKYDAAQTAKEAFDKSLQEKTLPKFNAVYQETTDARLQIPDDRPELRSALHYIQKKYLKNQQIDTTRKLTHLPLTMIGSLITESTKFQIKPQERTFFNQLRSLIKVALGVQWVGVMVSELWAVAVY